MSLLKKNKRIPFTKENKTPFYRKKGWKIFFLLSGLVSVFVISFIAYALSAGSKIFEDGIGGRSLLRTIYGKEQLKGEEENRINILITGMGGANHPGGMLTDSIMVFSIQPKEKRAAMISIPRDLLVSVPGHGDEKINSAFADGYNDYIAKNCNKKKDCRDDGIAAGANLTSQVVSNVLGIPIHYYVNADFNGFEKLINQLGGIDVYVDHTIYDPMFPDAQMKGYDPFKLSAGQHHLDGKTALKYARSRETTSDFDRAARQQKVIAAAKDKAMQLGFITNPQKIIDMISTVGSSLKTNFTLSEIKTFAEIIKDVQTDSITSKVLSTAPDGLLVDFNNGTYYERPKAGNWKEIQKMAQNIFSSAAKADPAKIEVLNGGKVSNAATKLAESLKSDDYNVVYVGNSKTVTKKTIIYDFSNGKQKDTLDYLKFGLNAEIIQKTSDSASKNIDIRIIIGDDYTGFSKKLND